MTKIDLRLSHKSEDDNKQKPVDSLEEQAKEQKELEQAEPTVEEKETKEKKEEERISIEEILASVGLDAGVDDEVCSPPPPTMDWGFIRRVCTAQIILSLISLACITFTVILGGMLWYKFTATVWTLFLLITAYTGHCAGSKKCYANMVAYCIMNAFQTFLHWGSMAWLIYMIYCLDDKRMQRQRVENDPKMDVILFLELGESLALLGTIMTGLFGMVACCKGFGRLLKAQDKKIMEEIEEQNLRQEQSSNDSTSEVDNPC